ncbi:MAG: HEPN domain-containing protein [Candidatus Jordarchaeaceae archaeon]
MELAESYLRRAGNKLYEAENHLKKYNYPESISAAQECIEHSVKAIFLLLQEDYPKKHEFEEKDFVKVLEKIPKKLEYLDIPKVYLYSRFWSNFYKTAKYGLEKLGVGTEKLFEREEATLTLKHSNKCRSAAIQLESFTKHPW